MWFLSSDEGRDDDDSAVVLFAVGGGETVDAVHEPGDGLAWGFLRDAGFHEAVLDALDAELLAGRVFRFVDAVGEHDERHLRAELGVEGVVFGELGREQAEAGAVRIDAADVVADVEDQLGVSGAGVFDRVFLLVQQADGERDVAAVAHVAEKIVVQLEEHGFQCGEVRDVGADETARHGHDEACRDALAAGVADHHEQAVGVDLDEVVEIAADLLRGAGHRLNGESAPLRTVGREQGTLERAREFEFLRDALLLAEAVVHLQDVAGKDDRGGEKGQAVDLLLREELAVRRGTVRCADDAEEVFLVDHGNREERFHGLGMRDLREERMPRVADEQGFVREDRREDEVGEVFRRVGLHFVPGFGIVQVAGQGTRELERVMRGHAGREERAVAVQIHADGIGLNEVGQVLCRNAHPFAFVFGLADAAREHVQVAAGLRVRVHGAFQLAAEQGDPDALVQRDQPDDEQQNDQTGNKPEHETNSTKIQISFNYTPSKRFLQPQN